MLPEVYQNLQLGDWLDLEIEEKKATCDNCLMSRPERGNLPYYDSKLKCCTYHPFVPNFLLGAILEDRNTASFIFDVLKEKEKNRSYLLPIGGFPPVSFQVLFNNRQECDFGNRQDWLCPYYDKNKNLCGIWKNRGATCTTYFCTSDYGKSGTKFWSVLFELLTYIEIRLAEKALRQMGFSEDEINNQAEYFDCIDGTDEEMESIGLSQALWSQFWNNRDRNIFEFYKQTYKIVSQFSLAEVQSEIKDAAFKKMENKLHKIYNRLL
jgi:Fe-S-cluster containining protein